MRVEDGEFTLRCLYRSKIAAIPEPLVQIRKHETNFSRDLVPRLVDEVSTLLYIKKHHTDAAPYHHIIDDEIEIRTVQAFNAAFAAKDHATTAMLFERLPQKNRSFKLRVKGAISKLPDLLGIPLNTSLQALTGRGSNDTGVR